MIKALEGPNGEKSSKRLFAAILMTLGSVMGVYSWWYCLHHPITKDNAHFILELIALFIGPATILDGLGIFDKVKDKVEKVKAKVKKAISKKKIGFKND